MPSFVFVGPDAVPVACAGQVVRAKLRPCELGQGQLTQHNGKRLKGGAGDAVRPLSCWLGPTGSGVRMPWCSHWCWSRVCASACQGCRQLGHAGVLLWARKLATQPRCSWCPQECQAKMGSLMFASCIRPRQMVHLASGSALGVVLSEQSGGSVRSTVGHGRPAMDRWKKQKRRHRLKPSEVHMHAVRPATLLLVSFFFSGPFVFLCVFLFFCLGPR